MSRSTEFKREIDKLFERHSHWLRTLLDKPRLGSKPKPLKRPMVKKSIARLQDLASDAFAANLARREFKRGVRRRKTWFVTTGKGWRYDQKRSAFNDWYDRHFESDSCIYVFWHNRKCVYVGKTTRGGRRASSHFDRAWFHAVTRVDMYTARSKIYLPALECLAIHRFQPIRNKFKAESRKWTRKCPLCQIHKDIEQELKTLFRLR